MCFLPVGPGWPTDEAALHPPGDGLVGEMPLFVGVLLETRVLGQVSRPEGRSQVEPPPLALLLVP